jgi:flagellar basal body-associated protein FliL
MAGTGYPKARLFQSYLPMPDSTPAVKTSKKTRRVAPMTMILWVVVVVLAAGFGYMYWKNNELTKPEAQTKLAEQASQNVIDSVSKLIIVPEDKPTVATITDVNKLRESNESFYKNAQNGDTLLLYSTQAIIYRSAENKIISVAPVVVSPSSETTEDAATTEIDAGTTPEETNTTPETENTTEETEANATL